MQSTLMVLLMVPFLLAMTIVGIVAFVLPLLYGIYEEFKIGIGSGLFAAAIYGTLAGSLLVLIAMPWLQILEILIR